MSYDIQLTDPITGNVLETDTPHQMNGGTYQIGGTRFLWLNVTYNYSIDFYRVFDCDKGIRSIYGLTGAESLPLLDKAIASLGDNVDEDYWKPTEGNAKRALIQLRTMAAMRPDGIWEGD